MAWIFQGNPKKFDIDDYLARYPELVYWRVPRYQSEIAVGDRAFIWRAGSESGVVASGIVVEAPVGASKILHPEALGDDLWFAEKSEDDTPRVGIALDTVRLSVAEGMLPRAVVKEHPLLQHSNIIRMANTTISHLDDEKCSRMEELWRGRKAINPDESGSSVVEGRLQLRAHRRRERSHFIIRKKLEEFRHTHGLLHCEICTLAENSRYPSGMAASVFEVHHMRPLASAVTPQRTTLADLAVLCANCHRAVHATSEVESNLKALTLAFAK